MKTNKLEFVEGKYNLHYYKNPSSRVFIPAELNDEISVNIRKNEPMLEYYASVLKKPIKFAPKGNSTLMNIGTFTTLIDNYVKDSEFVNIIKEHIEKVSKKTEFPPCMNSLERKLEWAEGIVKIIEKILKIKI